MHFIIGLRDALAVDVIARGALLSVCPGVSQSVPHVVVAQGDVFHKLANRGRVWQCLRVIYRLAFGSALVGGVVPDFLKIRATPLGDVLGAFGQVKSELAGLNRQIIMTH